MGKYDDIINLPHHESQIHPRMSMENRAAQFAPFAALSGHEDAIYETARVTEYKKDLSEEEIDRISGKVKLAFVRNLPVKIRMFIPDKSKKGWRYKTITGTIKKIDNIDHLLILEDLPPIPIDNIINVIITS